jgi:hypothetical protein
MTIKVKNTKFPTQCIEKFMSKIEYTILNQNMLEHLKSQHSDSEPFFYQTNTFNKVIQGCCCYLNPNLVNIAPPPAPPVHNKIKPLTRKEIFAKYTVKIDKRRLRKAD